MVNFIQTFIINKGNTKIGGDVMFMKRKHNMIMDMDMDMHMRSMVKVAVAGILIYQATKFIVNQFMDD